MSDEIARVRAVMEAEVNAVARAYEAYADFAATAREHLGDA